MKDYKYCPICGEPLKKAFIEGRDRLACKKCEFVYYKNPGPVMACLVLNSKGELLLIKRGIEPGKGNWALPGGFIEFGETIQEAGCRELKEETDLDSKAGRLIDVHVQKSEMYGFVLVVGMEFIIKKENTRICDEVLAVEFFPKKKLPDIPYDSHRMLIERYLALQL